MQKMKATVFHGPNNIRLEEVPRPRAGVGEAVIRITLTTICGSDLHILKRSASRRLSKIVCAVCVLVAH